MLKTRRNYCRVDIHSHSDGSTQASETYLHSHTHPLSDLRTNRQSRARADVDAYPFTYRDTDAYRDAFTNPYACRYRDSFANTNPDTRTDVHLGSHRNAY